MQLYTFNKGVFLDSGILRQIVLVMKVTTLLVFAFLMQVSAAGLAQKITLNERNASLESVMDKIRSQTGYEFVFNVKDIDNAKRVNISFKAKELNEALEELFQDQALSFSVKDRFIVVKLKEKSFLDKIKSAFADTDVRGRVVDEKGNPMPNASIRVKGKDAVFNTNDKGEFVIKGVADNAVLIISYVGYKQLEISVKDAIMPLEIKLNQVTGELEEVKVVYNTGFQLIDRTRSTGSFVQIDNELLNRRVGSNIIDRLEGVTNGLLFDRRVVNGTPKNNLQIRGFYSLDEQTASPLIILDNFPYYGDINNINPNDIESVTILRDAAAASIWGAKAGNGVIVLTSKKGKFEQPLQISANYNISVQGKPKLFNLPILGTSDWIDLEKFYFSKGAYEDQINSFIPPPLSAVTDILLKQRNGVIDQKTADTQIDALRSQDVRNDFLKYIYRNAVNQISNLNLSGGSSTNTYRMSIGYDKSLSELIGNKNDRISINLSNAYRPINALLLNFDVGYSITSATNNSFGGFQSVIYNRGGYGTAYFPMSLYTRLADDQGNPLAIPYQFSLDFTNTLGNGQLLDWSYNPLKEQAFRNNKSRGQAFLGSFQASYKPFSFLSANFSYRYQRNRSETNDLNDETQYSTRFLINNYTNLSASNAAQRYPVPRGGILFSNVVNLESHGLRGQINFDHTFGSDHMVSSLMGFNLDQARNFSNRNTSFGYNTNLNVTNVDLVNKYPTIIFGGAPFLIPANVGFDDTFNRSVSVFSNFSYSYRKRYTATGSIRRDASNLFGVTTNNKWKPLWSAGLGWNISNEPFYEMEFLPVLSLRTSYGYAGNINNTIAAYNILGYQPATSSTLTNLPYAIVTKLGNPDLKWEEVNTINFGIDFASKGQIFSGSIEYYKKKSKDVIAPRLLDQTTGYSTILTNSAGLKGNGINIALNVKIISSRNFNWNSSLNISSAKYKVTELSLPDFTGEGYGPAAGITIARIVGLSPWCVFQ